MLCPRDEEPHRRHELIIDDRLLQRLIQLLNKQPCQVIAGGDLDVPGAELDDNEEQTGNEDEENNYYCIGGDVHDNLEEDKGE